MSHGFLAFVDESGSEGPDTHFEFIVIAAVVVRVDNYSCLMEVYDRARRLTRKPANWDFPKFIKHNSDQQKFLLAQLIGGAPVRLCAIIAHKPSITASHMQSQHGDLYFFLSQLLLERISWICRDGQARSPSGNGKARIIFSERKSLSPENFRYYVNHIRNGRGPYPSNTHWAAVDTSEIVAREHTSCEGLRIADFVASAIARAIEYKEFGITDDRFVRHWGDVIYRYKGKCLRNGFKIFPTEAEAPLLAEDRLLWFKNFYKQ